MYYNRIVFNWKFWRVSFCMLLEVGNVVEGKVSGITAFGAFVQLPEGKTGLVHISEIAEEYVKDVSSHLRDNQVVKVKILSIEQSGKIGLSIRKAIEPKKVQSPIAKAPAEFDWTSTKNNINSASMSFEDRLAKFMKDSDERLHDLKKNVDNKRGGGGYKKSTQF